MAVAGKVAITPKGEWNANTAYTKLDLVFYDNASYVAIQPSTGVTPTNTAYWMLVVQSAGGADLEAIIDGTTQVGNAKTLDGHGAEYFFPKTGGTINGNVMVSKNGAGLVSVEDTANGRQIGLLTSGGKCGLYDYTNSKWIVENTADGTNTFNGTASGNLPLNGGGIVESTSLSPLGIKNTGANAKTAMRYYNGDTLYGYLGFSALNTPILIKADFTSCDLLHTGNKPTGTYTGNGSATERTIATNGTGSVCVITATSSAGAGFMIVTANGSVGVVAGNSYYLSYDVCRFVNGQIIMATDRAMFNASGTTYTYQVL